MKFFATAVIAIATMANACHAFTVNVPTKGMKGIDKPHLSPLKSSITSTGEISLVGEADRAFRQ
eukprot:11163320-Ditylum_brightwellii.AAC.1